ncbi:hypothetical protein ATANTOWER_010849 [Ataeniobius toweri]|uniref:Uncharacterized protein n=1 Tax=Ataeniobius toweri TaxID=208326 RepID=A0ABU7BPE9_9TELE|nr:hypothetical protein [Ataeniobius toweri]
MQENVKRFCVKQGSSPDSLFPLNILCMSQAAVTKKENKEDLRETLSSCCLFGVFPCLEHFSFFIMTTGIFLCVDSHMKEEEGSHAVIKFSNGSNLGNFCLKKKKDKDPSVCSVCSCCFSGNNTTMGNLVLGAYRGVFPEKDHYFLFQCELVMWCFVL